VSVNANVNVNGATGRFPALRALTGAGFRRYSRYRGAMIGGAVTNSVFGLLRASVVSATVTAAGGTLAGYDVRTAVTYAWVTQALIAPVELFTWNELALRVRTGDIAIDLARPIDLQLAWGAADAGRALAVLLPRALPTLAVGALTFGLAAPGSAWAYPAGALAVALAVAISFCGRFAVNLLAFWLVDIRGVNSFYVFTSNLLSGLYVPVHWFPGWLGVIAAATPFPSLVQAPTDVLTGRVSGSGIVTVLAVQGFWLAVTLGLGRVLLRRATAKLVVQGG
jgi:ABC-2 type transport system permease protein